jgi:hypothetical protein
MRDGAHTAERIRATKTAVANRLSGESMMRRIILAAMLTACFGSIATPATAVVVVLVAPPPLRAEVSPPPRPGHVWVNGHWEWRQHHHQWIAGTWLRERHGYRYSQPAWVERDGRWYMERGTWRREDRDGDGVPNGQDRAPDNPTRH